MPRCAGSKRDGSPCERIVSASQRHCFAHDPAEAERRSRNASRAARSKPSRELGAVKERLRELAEDVLAGRVDQDAAAVASRILGVYVRAAELERKARITDELAEELRLLKERVEGGQRAAR